MPIVKMFLLLVLILLTPIGNATGEGQGDEERRTLLEQQNALNKRITLLKARQDYLLFLKALSATDSKFLVLSRSSRTGQLKYKNRILRNFRFSTGPGRTPLPKGTAALTKKNESAGGRNEMIFGSAFTVQRKGLEVRRARPAPRLLLLKKDFKAVFSALEEGARAYVLP